MPYSKNMFIDVNGEKVPFEMMKIGAVQTVELEAPPKLQLRPVNRCIYCAGEVDLSDEHIIPYGLSGDDVLPKASCKACATQTGRFEQKVLRGPLRAARIFRRLKSRTKHQGGSNTQRATLVIRGVEDAFDLPLDEYPILLHFPVFDQPGYLSGRSSTGIQLKGFQTILFGPNPELVAKRFGASEIKFPATTEQPIEFAKLIAKIAYGYAVATDAISSLDGPSFVLPCIRGLADDVGQWVFTDDSSIVTFPGCLHRVDFHHMKGLLIAEVHLFADCQTPRYGVVLGRLKSM